MSVFYCKQEDFEGCPYRLTDLEFPRSLCRYIDLWAEIVNDRDFSEISRLTSKACDWIKLEEGRAETTKRLHNERFRDFRENVQVGDTVFCKIPPFHDVKLIDKPSDDTEYVRCEALNGKIIKIMACHLYRMAKGDYSGEYLVKGVFSRRKTLKLEFKSKLHGFRTEIEKKSDGYLLKIFGDSQKQVDDFIFMVLEHKLDLERFLTGPSEKFY